MRNLDSKSICLDSFVTNSDSTVPLGRLFDSIDPLLTSPELSSVMGEEQNLGSLSQVRKDTEAGCCALVIEIDEEVVRN